MYQHFIYGYMASDIWQRTTHPLSHHYKGGGGKQKQKKKNKENSTKKKSARPKVINSCIVFRFFSCPSALECQFRSSFK